MFLKPVHTSQLKRPLALSQRVEELRAKPPEYINHGEALLLQGIAAASLREQVLAGDRSWLDD
ncbi:hypothetical protein [Ruegeria sp. Ofav3-42]|uniref:hypothetical protein n=1 Tax=Ruegeria sp. Ofav3-42 TaxID=2917759 RepID=UPI001EF5D707|nr:hypothetical protein [Ruegeria sp. Ofav3-42]MCG7518228.1 hypothetical protein [Ruegeria sp. Ofav3-42]